MGQKSGHTGEHAFIENFEVLCGLSRKVPKSVVWSCEKAEL
jgi:hypothetical protein